MARRQSHLKCKPDSLHVQIVNMAKEGIRFDIDELAGALECTVPTARSFLGQARAHLRGIGDPGFIQHPDDDGKYTYVVDRSTANVSAVGRARRVQGLLGRLVSIQSDLLREADIRAKEGEKMVALAFRQSARGMQTAIDVLELLGSE